MKIKVGDTAPDFNDIPDAKGNLVSLKDFKDKVLVLYFYPRDNTSVCTAQACEFRDRYQKFIEAGADVVGVSSDSSESHTKFTSKYSLPFTLLTDKDSQLAKKYDVNGFLIPGRVTFIIDRNQKISMVHSALLSSTSHIEESLKVIEKLKSQL